MKTYTLTGIAGRCVSFREVGGRTRVHLVLVVAPLDHAATAR